MNQTLICHDECTIIFHNVTSNEHFVFQSLMGLGTPDLADSAGGVLGGHHGGSVGVVVPYAATAYGPDHSMLDMHALG